MVLLEACRQAAIATAYRLGGVDGKSALVTACKAKFTGFAELELATRCRASVSPNESGSASVAVTLEQADSHVGYGEFEVATWV